MEDLRKMKSTTAKMAAVPLFVILVTVVIQLVLVFAIELELIPGIVLDPDSSVLLASFSQVVAYLLAVFFVKLLMKKDSVKIRFRPRSGMSIAPLILAAVGLIIAASRFSAILNSIFFGYFDVASDSDMFAENNIFVIFIVTVIIPAFFEELVFRGLILTNLLPYGRSFAIIVSGIIFGVIHGTVSQILFATLAGIVLGWIYVETDSVWCGVLVHFINNLISVCEGGIISALPYETAIKYIYIIEIAVLLIGIASAVYVAKTMKRRRESATENGFFGIKPSIFRPAEKAVDLRSGLSAFFNPIMIIFVLYSILPIFLV